MNFPLDIREHKERIESREVTCVGVVEMYLGRAKSLNEELNAYITITDEYAYARAKHLDKLFEADESIVSTLPLFGVPIAIKDIYLTKGIRTTAASRVLETYIPQYSGTVVKRLEDAGAIIIGKANCDAWAHGASGENSDFGPTKNPWNTEYVPGGSSSGSGAAVSADMALISMGTDTGGSIRLPASFTNTVGLKPTYGAVSRYGVIAMASSLDTMGHFTRTVEDSETIFKVTRGVDGFDSTLVDNKYVEPKKGPFKIGIPKEYFQVGLDPRVAEVIENAKKTFEKLGVTFVEVSLPHTKYAVSTYYIVQPAEVSSNLGRFDNVRFGNSRSHFGAEAKRRIMLGTYVLSSGYYDAYYAKAQRVRSKIIGDFREVFNEVDALLTPVSPTLPFKLGEKSSAPLSMYLADVYTVAGSLAGIPGLAIPGGFSEDKLPIGFQLLGPHFGENTLFELGKMYQAETDWHKSRPSI